MFRSFSHMRFSVFACATLSLALLVGCGSGGKLPVKGKVTYADGQPVAGGTITFSNSTAQTSSVGAIKPDGTFVLGTEAEADGAPPGEYRVTVSDERAYGQPSSIASQFQDLAKTPLVYSVKPDGNNEFEIKVERATR